MLNNKINSLLTLAVMLLVATGMIGVASAADSKAPPLHYMLVDEDVFENGKGSMSLKAWTYGKDPQKLLIIDITFNKLFKEPSVEKPILVTDCGPVAGDIRIKINEVNEDVLEITTTQKNKVITSKVKTKLTPKDYYFEVLKPEIKDFIYNKINK